MSQSFSTLNFQQHAAATYAGGEHVLVDAGAGCGKTRTIIGRIRHLLDIGIPANRILCVTFTNRAAREIRERLEPDTHHRADSRITVGTFHAWCLKVMKGQPGAFGVKSAMVLDSDDQLSLVRMVMEQLARHGTDRPTGAPQPLDMLNWLSFSRNKMMATEKYLNRYVGLRPDHHDYCLQVYRAYQQQKHLLGYVDYDDLLALYVQRLTADKQLRHHFGRMFDEVLIDEMQDTNPIQWAICRLFADTGTRLFCVGDSAQSIYRFRGADVRLLSQFTRLIRPSVVLPLSVNYRSHQKILDLSNQLLDQSDESYGEPLIASDKRTGPAPRLCKFASQQAEAAWVASQIQQRKQTVPMSEIMILVRTSWCARAVEAALISERLPYRFIGGQSLLREAHVRDVLALVRLIVDPSDTLAWMRYLAVWPNSSTRNAYQLNRLILNGNDPLPAAAGVLGDRHRALLAYHQCAEYRSNPQALLTIAVQTMAALMTNRRNYRRQCQSDLNALVDIASQYHDINTFLTDFLLEPGACTNSSEDDDRLTIITVHSAKGTEATCCFLVNAHGGSYPHKRSWGDPDDEEEERRVLYVAMTRAKRELIISYAVSGEGGADDGYVDDLADLLICG